MNTGRYDVGVAVLDNVLYAVGGSGYDFDELANVFNACEKYDVETDTWSQIASK